MCHSVTHKGGKKMVNNLDLMIKEVEEKERKKQERERKNNNFVMIYREHMPEIRWLMQKNGTACSILNFIMEHMDSKNALVCSAQVFMDYFEVSRSTITRCIKLLKDSGFIDVLRSGSSNIYVVNQEVAWTSWKNQKKYCKFEGNVLISATENKDYYYRSQFDRLKALRENENIKI